MGERTSKDEQGFYICGQCKDRIYHLKSEKPVIPCPDCGWQHGAKENKVPAEVKLNLPDYE